jgi:hypothetical protein
MDDKSKISEMKKQLMWKNITILCLLVAIAIFIVREVLAK